MGILKQLIHLIPFMIVSSTLAGHCMAAGTVKGAYWPSWSYQNYPPSRVDTTLFTHIFYAFLQPNETTFTFDVSNDLAPVLQDFTSTLHRKNPPVKALFSIGGGDADPVTFARMAATTSSRATFIKSAIATARKYGFDGFDLDWESPQSPKEMQDMGVLFDEWRNAIRTEAMTSRRAPLLLTAAVYFAPEFLWDNNYRKFPTASIQRNLDFINTMNYDYRGSWDTSATGAQALWFDPNSNISTSYGLTSWIESGVARNKVVMGSPLYGRTWKLRDPNVNGIGAPAVDVGPGDGTLIYSEIVEFNEENSATVVYDAKTVSTYSYAGLDWIGYDDVRSTITKLGLAKRLGIGGYFFWALSFDNADEISRQASRAWGLEIAIS